MHYGVLPTVGMRGYGTECAKRPRAFVGEGSAEAFDIGIDGHSERANRDSDIQCVSVSEKTPYWGNHFWAKGYCVDTVGLNSEMIQKYVRFQEKEEQHQEQLMLEPDRAPSRKAR